MTHESKTKQIYDIIKKKILYCELTSGEPIYEKSLIIEIGFGRTPIREAPLKLSNEGLVRILPRRGMIVSELSIKDVMENYQIREIIETSIFKHTSRLINKADLPKYRDLFMAILEKHEEFNIIKYLEYDWEFHYFLVEHLNNKKLLDFLKLVYEQNIRFRIACYRKRSISKMLMEHLEIIDLLDKGDYDKACESLQVHIINSRDAVIYGYGFPQNNI